MRPLVVDLFAGAGGASEGIRAALGRDPDIAVNHSALALAMHAVNHPRTVHLVEDVFDVNPRKVVGDRPVGLLWMSPDCTQHSRAKGGKPRQKNIRSLACVAHRWASEVRPAVIALENVPEFLDWGPLDEHDRPIPARKGEDFRAWAQVLRAHGYAIDWRVLVAAIVAGGGKDALVAAFITKHYGGVIGHEVDRAIGTVTAKDHHSLTAAWLMRYNGTGVGHGADEPLGTVTGVDRFAEVRALLGARALAMATKFGRAPVAPPIMAEVLVRANVGGVAREERAA